MAMMKWIVLVNNNRYVYCQLKVSYLSVILTKWRNY